MRQDIRVATKNNIYNKTEAFRFEFGQAVRKRRREKGFSQEELADRCGLHRTYISEIERGLKAVSLVSLLHIAGALGVPAYMLVKEAEAPGRSRE
jgi:transcriptional regulator with XRE-family HTH domain